MLGAEMARLAFIYKRNAAKNHPNPAWQRGRIATGRPGLMGANQADFLVIGSTPLARLLAGLLASSHGKSVLLQCQNRPVQRLQLSLDLSVAAITRPESWAMLGAGVPETTRLLRRIGARAAMRRLDPILYADSAAAQQALSHVRHMAAAAGLAAERMVRSELGADRAGLVLRDAVALDRGVLEPALDRWLAQLKLQRLPAGQPVQVAANGAAQTMLDGRVIEIGQTVLADDAAILRHVAEAAWPALLQRQSRSAIVTPALAPIAAPVMIGIDDGVVLRQQAEGHVLGHGPGNVAALAARLGRLLGKPEAFEQAGQTSAMQLITSDGGPALGRLGGTGPDVLAGLGATGLFVAPALARWLGGVANPAENAWFGARLINRDPASAGVSDIGEMR